MRLASERFIAAKFQYKKICAPSSPARRIIVAEAGSATAGAGPRERSFHGGKVAVHRPRAHSYDGHEVALPTWTAAQAEDWLGRWAMNLMLINVSTRKLRRAVRLPQGRSAGHCRGRHLEVSGLAPVRGTIGRTAGRVDGV